MRVRFVSKEGLPYTKVEEEGVALTLFGFNGLQEVSYEKELRGESSYFEAAAKLSKREQNVVVCGCVTNTLGHKRKSALVAEKGKLLGISDALQAVDGACSCGAELKIYETQIGRMGVAVAEDLYCSEFIKALVLCGSDFIVCPFGKIKGELQSVLLRAQAFQFGVPILLCGRGYAMLASPKGEIVFSSPLSPVCSEYVVRKEYHLIERRKRGVGCTEV